MVMTMKEISAINCVSNITREPWFGQFSFSTFEIVIVIATNNTNVAMQCETFSVIIFL